MVWHQLVKRGAVGVLVAAALLWSAPAGAAASCQAVDVPVTVPGTPGASVYGELCGPARGARTVHLLVPGSTSTHAYYDLPDSDRYSYVRKAVDAGYATFNVDRIGSGRSTRPASAQITLETGAYTLHEVIGALRSGAVGGHEFPRVVWVGHSLGSIYGWVEASRHQDVDAFVLTGMTHALKSSFIPTVAGSYYPAIEDPKFASSGFDPGYLTTKPGTRPGMFFFRPGADPRVISRDEELKDTVSSTEFNQAVGLITSPPPETAPSRAIMVPTLLVIGDHDLFFCGGPDGIDCTAATIVAGEAPYYRPEARLQALVAANSSHSPQLHLTAPRTTAAIIDWVDATITP